jgi:hypothetical protein
MIEPDLQCQPKGSGSTVYRDATLACGFLVLGEETA